jgi:hypothetical protein
MRFTITGCSRQLSRILGEDLKGTIGFVGWWLWQSCGLYLMSTASEDMPLAEVERIKHNFEMNFVERVANPVVKVLLEVLNVNERLQVVPAANNNENLPNGAKQVQQQHQQSPQQQQLQGQQANRQLLAYIQHVQQENLQWFDMIQAEQQATRAWMQQMFDRVITNQRHYGGTVYSSLARGNWLEQQRRDLQQQRAAADAAAKRMKQQRSVHQEQQVQGLLGLQQEQDPQDVPWIEKQG